MHPRYAALDQGEVLAAGHHLADPIPHGGPRWGISVVARPPTGVARRLADAAAEIAKLARTTHVAYAPEDIHVTVTSLGGYQASIEEADVRAMIDDIRATMQPFTVMFGGVVAATSGAIAWGLASEGLQATRESIARMPRPGCLPGGDGTRIRDTAHASLLVFRDPIVPEPGLAAAVAAMHDCELGEFAATRLEIVRYDVSEQRIQLVPLASTDGRYA